MLVLEMKSFWLMLSSLGILSFFFSSSPSIYWLFTFLVFTFLCLSSGLMLWFLFLSLNNLAIVYFCTFSWCTHFFHFYSVPYPLSNVSSSKIRVGWWDSWFQCWNEKYVVFLLTYCLWVSNTLCIFFYVNYWLIFRCWWVNVGQVSRGAAICSCSKLVDRAWLLRDC